MHFHYSLAHADRVLSNINELESTFDLSKVSVQAWSNCREQGYYLESIEDNKALCLAQHRNTNNITIVFGKTSDFDLTTNQPNEEVFKTRLSFDDDYEAAEWIARYLAHPKEVCAK